MEQTNSLEQAVGRVEGGIDAIHKTLERIEKRYDKQDSRITAVERKVWWATGAGACVAFVATKLGLGVLH